MFEHQIKVKHFNHGHSLSTIYKFSTAGYLRGYVYPYCSPIMEHENGIRTQNLLSCTNVYFFIFLFVVFEKSTFLVSSYSLAF